MKKRFDRSGTARRKAVTAIAALTMALVLAVGGAGAATLLSAQPETLTVGAVVPHITAGTPQASSPAAADPAPEAESTVAAPEQAAESAAQPQQTAPAPEQTEKPETTETAPSEPKKPQKHRKPRRSPLRIPHWKRKTLPHCCWRRPRSWPHRTRRLPQRTAPPRTIPPASTPRRAACC